MATLERSLPIRIGQDEHGIPSVVLGEMEIAGALARDGVQIRYVDDVVGIPRPEITLTFAPGALVLDFDVDLLYQMLAEKDPAPNFEISPEATP